MMFTRHLGCVVFARILILFNLSINHKTLPVERQSINEIKIKTYNPQELFEIQALSVLLLLLPLSSPVNYRPMQEMNHLLPGSFPSMSVLNLFMRPVKVADRSMGRGKNRMIISTWVK